MKTIKISDYFSAFCSNGEEATTFLLQIVLPEIEQNEKVCFDFLGVRNMNSSFSNALFTNLIRKCSQDVMKKITFAHCSPNIKMLISISLNMGLEELKRKKS